MMLKNSIKKQIDILKNFACLSSPRWMEQNVSTEAHLKCSILHF